MIDDIKNKRFPNDFKGSSLEAVLTAITEQKQVFEGAAHPQLARPAVKNNCTLIKYIFFSELRQHCDALCRFEDSHRIMEKIARAV